MKKITWALVLCALLIGVICLYSRCTKVNTDQPCGVTQDNKQLFKDADNKCYYVDPSSHKNIYVDKSQCDCY